MQDLGGSQSHSSCYLQSFDACLMATALLSPWSSSGRWTSAYSSTSTTARLRDALLTNCPALNARDALVAVLSYISPIGKDISIASKDETLSIALVDGKGKTTEAIKLSCDGKARSVRFGGAQLPTRIVSDPNGGAMELEVSLPGGFALVSVWLLVGRCVLEQTVELIAASNNSATAAGASGQGRRKATASCTWTRVETPEEKVAAEALVTVLAQIQRHLAAASRIEEEGLPLPIELQPHNDTGSRKHKSENARFDDRSTDKFPHMPVAVDANAEVAALQPRPATKRGGEATVALNSQRQGQPLLAEATLELNSSTGSAYAPLPRSVNAALPASPLQSVERGRGSGSGQQSFSGSSSVADEEETGLIGEALGPSEPAPPPPPPPSKPVNWSGVWWTDKSQSDSVEPFLKLLGLGYLTRKLVMQVIVICC